MAASLDEIEAALFAALAAIGPGPDGTEELTYVGRYAGEVTASSGVDQEVLGRAPAALLALEADDPDPRGGITTLAGPTQLVARATWRVYVAVEDPRGVEEAVKGTTGLPGLLSSMQAVLGALAGLVIAGLLPGETVRYAGARPSLIQRGTAYVYLMRFTTERAVDLVVPADDSAPLEHIRGNVNQQVPAGGDAATNPFDTFDAPTT